MTRTQQIDHILELLSSVWKKHPEQRLGQLIDNSTYLFYKDLFLIDDDTMTLALQNVLVKGGFVE